MHRRTGFTLIELLVVIAIIAILAAILFPVFAQAKVAANKTKTLAQFKQVGTSVAIYLSDHDDTMPLAMSFSNSTRKWRHGSFSAIPEGWSSTDSRDVDPRRGEEASMVINALRPYIKNQQIFEAAGIQRTDSGWTRSATANLNPTPINLSMNGLLHGYSGTAVESPSRLPLFWSGHFRQNIDGRALSNPALWCDMPTPECRFNPGGYPQAGANTLNRGNNMYNVVDSSRMSVFMYGKTMPFISVDTSARVLNLSGPVYPQVSRNINTNPFSSFRAPANGLPEGVPYWVTDCVTDGAAYGSMPSYFGYFRPDSDFDWNLNSCNFNP